LTRHNRLRPRSSSRCGVACLRRQPRPRWRRPRSRPGRAPHLLRHGLRSRAGEPARCTPRPQAPCRSLVRSTRAHVRPRWPFWTARASWARYRVPCRQGTQRRPNRVQIRRWTRTRNLERNSWVAEAFGAWSSERCRGVATWEGRRCAILGPLAFRAAPAESRAARLTQPLDKGGGPRSRRSVPRGGGPARQPGGERRGCGGRARR